MTGHRLAFFVAACVACNTVTFLPVGTRVPMTDLYARRADLAAFVHGEIEAGRFARAFYALELEKTRPYAEQALAARATAAPTARDLRPVLLAMLSAHGDEQQRGLVLSAAGAITTFTPPAGSEAMWKHMHQFESRTAPLNERTMGIRYDYAARYGYGVTTAEETARLFARDEAFVSYFVHGDAVTVFVVFRGALATRKLDASATALRERAQRFVKLVRAPPTDGDVDAWIPEARALGNDLLGPVRRIVGEGVALFVSPHGFLANVPFALLLDAHDRPQIETARVIYVPSASIYRELVTRPILNAAPHMLAVGNAIYPSGIPALAFAEKEAITVSEVFPGGLLLHGATATEARVGELAPTFNILHFATHGVLLGSVVPGGSSLLLTADDAHDGLFSAAEIARLDLSHTYIAVLSACETSVTEDTGLSIDLGTITNAFLTAGAPTVVGTMWQVDDSATTALMLDFYREFLVVGAGEALRRAQLAVRALPRFHHPYYWGAFALFGWDK